MNRGDSSRCDSGALMRGAVLMFAAVMLAMFAAIVPWADAFDAMDDPVPDRGAPDRVVGAWGMLGAVLAVGLATTGFRCWTGLSTPAMLRELAGWGAIAAAASFLSGLWFATLTLGVAAALLRWAAHRSSGRPAPEIASRGSGTTP